MIADVIPFPILRELERGDHAELAEKLLQQLRTKGDLIDIGEGPVHNDPPRPVVFADGTLYLYDRGRHVFAVVDVAEQRARVLGMAGHPVKTTKGTKPLHVRRADAVGVTQSAWDLAADPTFFVDAPRGIMFADAFVRVTAHGIEVEHPAPEHRARYAYPFQYEPTPRPKRWLGFLADVFSGDADGAAKAFLLQEFGGACLLGEAWRYQRAIVMVGAGSNGKKVTTDVFARAMPPGSTVAIPPQQWGDQYRLAMLAGKHLNAVGELPEYDIISSETFKGVITGDMTTGRHIREAPFPFAPIAGHMFAANKLPGTVDHTHGFWRRFAMLQFNRVFAEGESNRSLADEIIASDLPHIVSWFVEGARRLLAQGDYTIPASSAAALAEWRQRADQVATYVQECTHELGADEPTKTGAKPKALYQDYRLWAADNGHKPLNAQNFADRMKLLGLPTAKVHEGWFYRVQILPKHVDRDALLAGIDRPTLTRN